MKVTLRSWPSVALSAMVLVVASTTVLEAVLADSACFSQMFFSSPNCTGTSSGPYISEAGQCYRSSNYVDFRLFCSEDAQYGYHAQYGQMDYTCVDQDIFSLQQIPTGCSGGVLTMCTNTSLGPAPPAFPPTDDPAWVIQTDCSAMGVDTCTSPAGPYTQPCLVTALNSGMCGFMADTEESGAFYCAANSDWAGYLIASDREHCQKGNFTSAILRKPNCTGGIQFDCSPSVAPTMPAPPNAGMIVFEGGDCTAANFGPAYLSEPGACTSFPGNSGWAQQLVCNTNSTVTVNIYSQADCGGQPQFSQTVGEGHCTTDLPTAICNQASCSGIFTCGFGNDWQEPQASQETIELE